MYVDASEYNLTSSSGSARTLMNKRTETEQKRTRSDAASAWPLSQAERSAYV
jgi:hypothetical protein